MGITNKLLLEFSKKFERYGWLKKLLPYTEFRKFKRVKFRQVSKQRKNGYIWELKRKQKSN